MRQWVGKPIAARKQRDLRRGQGAGGGGGGCLEPALSRPHAWKKPRYLGDSCQAVLSD